MAPKSPRQAAQKAKDIREAVQKELEFDPLVDASDIKVKNMSGDVALNGTVPAYPQYLPALLSICPEHWPHERKVEVAEMILAAARGFLIDRLTSGSDEGVEAGFAALARALDREEAAG